MSTNILFVFEGKSTEDKIVECLEKHILNDSVIIKCAYTSDVYQLYREIEKDEDLDIFYLIKERDKDNPIFEKYNGSDFSEIYLFFDYDGQADLASVQDKDGFAVKTGDSKMKDMLSFFNNETDKGKLYISYPMVEAIRHIIKSYDDFKDLKVKCKGKNCQYKETCKEQITCEKEPHYKVKVSSDSLLLGDYSKYALDTWKNIIETHLCKMNYIVNDTYTFPQKIESQHKIFTKQLEKYINHKCPMVGVLSAFPIFIFDYYGCEKTTKILTPITENNYDYNSIQELLSWAEKIIKKKRYPQEEFKLNQYTTIIDCGKHLEAMISTITQNRENPTIYYHTINQLRELRRKLEGLYYKVPEQK